MLSLSSLESYLQFVIYGADSYVLLNWENDHNYKEGCLGIFYLSGITLTRLIL